MLLFVISYATRHHRYTALPRPRSKYRDIVCFCWLVVAGWHVAAISAPILYADTKWVAWILEFFLVIVPSLLI